ncbi:MAG TPA: hypothetical protein VGC65_01435 [Bacteroidia bacterium]
MSFIVIDAEEYILKIHDDNYLEFIIKEGATLDVRVALEAKQIVEEYRPGIKFFVLAEGMNFFNITKEARELSATESFVSQAEAVAFLTTSISMIFLAEMYKNISKPPVKTKIFHTRDNARDWLKGQVQERAMIA